MDLADWKAHTEYNGNLDPSRGAAQLFWRVVEESFDDEQRVRLLQFVTGTARLPAGGFQNLQGVDGEVKRFKLLGIKGGDGEVPRAHTCFNRLDLPAVGDPERMATMLGLILAADISGFNTA